MGRSFSVAVNPSGRGLEGCGHAGGAFEARTVEGRQLGGEVDEAVVQQGLHGYEAGTEDPEIHFCVGPPLDGREGVWGGEVVSMSF